MPTKIASLKYIGAVVESIVIFTIGSFCLGVFFTHQGHHYPITSIILVALYLFTIVVTTKRLISRSSIAAIMLMIPIAPLIILILVVSLLHLLQLMR